MNNDEVYMDVPAVREMAKGLGTIGETLTNVVKVLDMLLTTLKTVAFIGLVGGAAVAQFIEMIKPYIEKLAAKFTELSGDVNASVDAFERGDQIGATRFY
jgi:F0F1-type ATP synthase beta subunit